MLGFILTKLTTGQVKYFNFSKVRNEGIGPGGGAPGLFCALEMDFPWLMQ